MYLLKAQGGLDWAVMTKTGPDDARRVVWVLGMSVSFSFVLLTVYTIESLVMYYVVGT